MVWTIRVSLPRYNALTDTNPDHFALNADEDDILIKEKSRGTIYVPNGTTSTIKHGLNHIPFVLSFAEVSAGRWIYVAGDSSDYDVYMELNTTNLILGNGTGATVKFKYYIFYDQQVWLKK